MIETESINYFSGSFKAFERIYVIVTPTVNYSCAPVVYEVFSVSLLYCPFASLVYPLLNIRKNM